MTKLTKAQLLSELEAARIENQRLAAENESLRTRGVVPRTPRPVRSYQPTAEQVEAHNNYVSALNAARELAIRTGRSVRVG